MTHGYEEKISDFLAKGQLSKEFILGRINERFGKEPVLERIFQSHCNDDGLVTEAAFIALLQTKANLPRSPEGLRAGQIIYASFAYLSNLPFPSSNPVSQPGGLSQAQIARAVMWARPSSHASTFEEDNCSRLRTKADHRRLIFQSLASRTCKDQKYDPESARQLALRNASLDVDWEFHLDICATNHDDDGDEIYHDLLEVLYSTQIVKHPWLSPVPRDAFRPVAKRIATDNELASLYAIGIPIDDFVSLAKLLLAFQFDVWKTPGVDLHQFDASAKSLCAAFCQQTEVITWPMFDHGLRNIAQYLFEPLYHMIEVTFLDEEGAFITGCELGTTIVESILTVPLMSQLSTLFVGCAYFPDLHRVQHYRANRPTPTTFVRELEDVPDEAFMLLSGTSTTTGQTYIFGVFSPKPKLDGESIQTSIVPNHEGLEPCSIFQLAPIQDIFRGVTGKPGWTVVDNDTVVFGQSGGDGDGVVMALKDGLRRLQITHRVLEEEETARVYEPNTWRGNWEISFEISDIEIWSELDQ